MIPRSNFIHPIMPRCGLIASMKLKAYLSTPLGRSDGSVSPEENFPTEAGSIAPQPCKERKNGPPSVWFGKGKARLASDFIYCPTEPFW